MYEIPGTQEGAIYGHQDNAGLAKGGNRQSTPRVIRSACRCIFAERERARNVGSAMGPQEDWKRDKTNHVFVVVRFQTRLFVVPPDLLRTQQKRVVCLYRAVCWSRNAYTCVKVLPTTVLNRLSGYSKGSIDYPADGAPYNTSPL